MGGGAMRAAARAAGMTVANGGLRGIKTEQYPAFSTTRRAATARPAAEGVKLIASQPEGSCSEMEDWVFAAVEVEADSMPRVVFGGAPTIEEAKEATSELTVALEKAYLSSPDSVSQPTENKAVTSEIGIAPTVPPHALQAFKILNESQAAQKVVASITCDPNVWSAVLQNQEFQDFIQSQNTSFEGSHSSNVKMEELFSDSDIPDQSSAKSVDESSNYAEEAKLDSVDDIVQKIKISVVDMMSSLSDYFQNFFGDQGGSNRELAYSNGNSRLNGGETVMEASFMGLAVMAIMVILLKRVE